MKQYKFYSDPSHGWLAVKRAELIALGILGNISVYSFQKGATVYLEEDADASLFVTTYEAKHGVKPAMADGSCTDNRSPVRSYEPFRLQHSELTVDEWYVCYRPRMANLVLQYCEDGTLQDSDDNIFPPDDFSFYTKANR